MTRWKLLVVWMACLLFTLPSSSVAGNPRVWLYTLVAADFDGASLLPHFLNYYHALGISFSHFLIMVHHDPSSTPNRSGLDKVLGICQSNSLTCRVWQGPFSSEAHYERSLRMLADYVYDPYDWIVVADNDEFQDWGGGLIKHKLQAAAMLNATWVKGNLLDRVAPGGWLTPIQPVDGNDNDDYIEDRNSSIDKYREEAEIIIDNNNNNSNSSSTDDNNNNDETQTIETPPPSSQSLFQQYPLRCHVVQRLYKGWTFKVVAFRNYLRAGRANHLMIQPDKAKSYLGPCPSTGTDSTTTNINNKKPKKCPRGRNINLDKDLYELTPYYWYRKRYKYPYISDQVAAALPPKLKLWEAIEHTAAPPITIHHFKWHQGVLESMRQRAEYYSGDCVLGMKEKSGGKGGGGGGEGGCTPRMLHWKESATTYRALKETMRLDTAMMGCDMAATPWQDVQIDTTDHGIHYY